MGGATGLEPATFCVRDGGAIVVVINSDRCEYSELIGTERFWLQRLQRSELFSAAL